MPCRARVPGHAGGRARHRDYSGRGQGDPVSGGPLRRHGQGLRVHPTNEVLAERGIKLPLPGQSTTTPENRAEKGLAVQQQIIGNDVVERLYASAPADLLHIQRYLSANCFGDNYTRTGLDVPTRELLTFSMLAALGGCEPQVKGHVAANLRVGNDRGRLIDVLTQLLPFIGYPRTLNALRMVEEAAASAASA